MNLQFNQTDLNQIISLLESDATDAIYSGAIKRLNDLSAAVSKKMTELYQSTAGRNNLLNMKVENYRQKEMRAIENGEYKESGIDSVDAARALLYCMKMNKLRFTTKSKLITILYQAYCTWLGSQGQRLCMEHPCHTDWGPWFWRVNNKIDLREDEKGLHEAYLSIARTSPGIAKFISNTAAKYHDCKDEDLQNTFKQSKPYLMASPEKNNGKKNTEIKDTEINEWKNSKI